MRESQSGHSLNLGDTFDRNLNGVKRTNDTAAKFYDILIALPTAKHVLAKCVLLRIIESFFLSTLVLCASVWKRCELSCGKNTESDQFLDTRHIRQTEI